MLSKDLVSQLSQLKQDIRSSRDVAQGTIRGTSGRYGFVVLDDGRDAFLNPEQMDRVFPGDRVEVEVATKSINDNNGEKIKEQYEATLEKLISSPLQHLSGRYRVRGKGHFIAADIGAISRWVFIPPKTRKQCEDGNYITAKVTRHPFKDGRAQASIVANIGDKNTPFIERKFTLSQFQLDESYSPAVVQQTDTIVKRSISLEDSHYRHYQDLSHITFVTIDSANTRDMDDALAIESNDNGWVLYVAIANPGADIKANSPLDQCLQQRAQTIYFPGKPLSMLPEALANERYSLIRDEVRSSLVCRYEIDTSGKVNTFEFIPALIKSHGKLSYTHVASLLRGDHYELNNHPKVDDPAPFQEALNALKQCTNALNHYRKAHYIVSESRPDFAMYLNDQGKLDKIEKIERNCAHGIVEEAMLLTNRCAGEFLAQHNAGLYIAHQGFREERRQDIESLLSEKLDTTISNTNELNHYIGMMKQLQSNDAFKSLASIQQRFLEASQLSHTPQPHFGLGFSYYANITSPIRRYHDLYNQRVIHQILTQRQVDTINDQQIDHLQQAIAKNRDAVRSMEQWLICDYMKDKVGKTFSGTIGLLTNQGVGIRLDDTGIEGFVAAAKPPKNNKQKTEETITGDKISFNNQRMELTWNGTPLALDQAVNITLKTIDDNTKKLEFSWTEKI